MKPVRSAFAVLLLGLIATGCTPFGLGGSVDGRNLTFDSAAYFELRGVEPSTGVPFHRIELWLTPFEEPCSSFGPLLKSLTDLRAQITEDSLDSTSYCNAWETLFEAEDLLDGFWLSQLRMKALPREDHETPEIDYLFLSEGDSAIPESPHWDADLAWYPPPLFEACSTEFTSGELYSPQTYDALGGLVTISSYSEDEEIEVEWKPSFASGEDTEGKVSAEFCAAVDKEPDDPELPDWPLEFGLGQ